jgi:hypothetical protein
MPFDAVRQWSCPCPQNLRLALVPNNGVRLRFFDLDAERPSTDPKGSPARVVILLRSLLFGTCAGRLDAQKNRVADGPQMVAAGQHQGAVLRGAL